MIEIKVTANLNGGNRILTATDKVTNTQEAYYSIVGFVTWFTSTYAKNDMVQVNQQLNKGLDIKVTSQAMVIFKYKSGSIKLQVTSKVV